jgi:cysteinyl-tRNA synthetase
MIKMETGPLYIYNSLSRNKEIFKPLIPNRIGLYVCGPTVYSEVHLGNVRTFLSFDVIYRYLKFLGYKVRYVRNITDVGHLVDDIDEGEDKIQKKARLENLEPMEVVQMYTNDFHKVMHLFNIQDPSIEPTATGHILEQIEMVQRILDKGLAYEVNGSVYFDVAKYNEKHDYGKLSGRKIEELIANTRDLDGQSDKRNPADFALWKKAEKGHLMQWNSPWGKGFPGWHLECSVMSTKYLGETFDIHGGGMDLKFPHHECEIAQSTAADGIEPVRYWMHTNMLTVEGKKMSKSLGNGFTPKELLSGDHPLLEQAYSPMTVRFFMLQGHYSSTLDFSNVALQAAEKGYARMMQLLDTLRSLEVTKQCDFDFEDFENKCYQAMNDDFNTPILIAHLFEGGKFINNVKAGTKNIDKDSKANMIALYESFLFDVLGFLPQEEKGNKELLNYLMSTIVEVREKAKKDKDYAKSDAIRIKLSEFGVTLKDSREGTEWEIN